MLKKLLYHPTATYRWSRTNRPDARMRWASAAYGTASIQTHDRWVIRSIVDLVLALRLSPNSWPAIWQSRRSTSVTRTLCSHEYDPEVWATLSPSPDPMIKRPNVTDRTPLMREFQRLPLHIPSNDSVIFVIFVICRIATDCVEAWRFPSPYPRR